MSRLLALWLTLLAAFWLTRAASSALLFGTADRSWEGVFLLVTVPALQALVVAWATRRPGPFAPFLPVQAALRRSDLRGILLLDAAVLATGWLLADDPWFGLAQGRNLPDAWIALKAGTAGVIFARYGRSAPAPERPWLLATAAALLGLALAVLFGVLRPLSGLLLPSQPRLLRWLAVHGLLFAAGTGLLLAVQRLLGHGRAVAALALDWALGLALLAGLITALHLARHATLPAPWGSLAATCSSLAVTALLAAALLAWDGGDEAKGGGILDSLR
jgi:hypothetical protein